MTKLTHGLVAASFAAIVSFGLTQYGLAAGSAPSSDTTDSAQSYNKALDKIHAGNYADAITLLQQVVEQDPSNADAQNELGFSLRKTGHLDESLDAYKKALALNPGHIDANEYLGELYLQMKKPDMAKQQLDVLTKLCPSGCEQREDLEKQLAAYKS